MANSQSNPLFKKIIMGKLIHDSLDACLVSISYLFINIAEENNTDSSIITPTGELLLKISAKVKSLMWFRGSPLPKDIYPLISVIEENTIKKFIQVFNKKN